MAGRAPAALSVHPGATLAAGGATGVAPALRRDLRPSGSPPFLPARHGRAASKCGAKAGDRPAVVSRRAGGPGYRTGGGHAPTRRVADGTGAHIGFRPEVNGSGGSRPKERGTTSGMSRSPHGRGERTGYLVEQNASPSVGYLRLGRVRERDRQPRGASGTNSATMRSPVAHFVADRDPPSGRWRTAAIGVFAARPESAESPSQRAAKHQGEPAGQTETVSYT